MKVKNVIDEDFVNYKKPSMYIGFPTCTFKCEKECGLQVCQNSILATSHTIEIDVNKLVKRYLDNNITSALILAGLEPFDSILDMSEFIFELRKFTDDDIVIYTGYYKEEVIQYLEMFNHLKNIIIKFGRYIPNQKPHYDNILGVDLASDNQYGEIIS